MSGAHSLPAIGDDAWIRQSLGDLVSINSVSGQENEAQTLVTALFNAAGASVRSIPVDAVDLEQRYSFRSPTKLVDAHSVVGSWASERSSDPLVVINGHIDTVPAGSGWSSSPWDPQVKDNWMYGLGTADMKAGIVGAAAGVYRARERGLRRVAVEIQSVVDEEAGGGTGSLACIDEMLSHDRRPAVVIVGEPTDLRVCTAQVGSRAVRFTVHGKSAHANSKHLGVSATELAIDLAQRLQLQIFPPDDAPHPLLPPASVNIGKIMGGTGATAVAERCVIEACITYHPIHSRDLADVISQVVSRWATDHEEPDFTYEHELLHDVHPFETDCDNGAVDRLRASLASPLAPAQLTGFPAGSDGRLFHEYLRVPTVIFGPGSVADIHKPNERVNLTDVSAYADAVASFLLALQSDLEA